MNTGDMIQLLTSYIDDVPVTDDAIRWFNMGKNKMAIEVKAKFPDLPSSSTDTGLTSEYVFDEKYHEIPVLYASAMYKAQDASIREKVDYMNQFREALANFSENYNPPMQYRDDELCQQFTATDGQTDFAVTSVGFDPTYGNLQVFKNGIKVSSDDYTLDSDTHTIQFTDGLIAGDMVTALWEEHAEFSQPPVSWWTF